MRLLLRFVVLFAFLATALFGADSAKRPLTLAVIKQEGRV